MGRMVQRSSRNGIIFVGYKLLAAKAACIKASCPSHIRLYGYLFHNRRLVGGNRK
jgi:hypothetical protein